MTRAGIESTDYEKELVMVNGIALVVDDRDDDQDIVARILRHNGFAVFRAFNGNQAIALLHQVIPSFIVTDLRMPQTDGWQLLQVIRSNPKWARIPVVAVTAEQSVDSAECAIGRGFDGFFPKPLHPVRFMDVVLTAYQSKQDDGSVFQ